MRRNRQYFLLLLAMISGWAFAHPYHFTTAEMQWKPEAARFEVALKVGPEELEEALSAGRADPLLLESTAGVDQQIVTWLEAHFIVTDAKGARLPVRWVGKEVDHEAAWLYFELPAEKAVGPFTLINTAFLDTEREQVNLVRFRHPGGQTGFRFSAASRPEILPGTSAAS